MKKLRKKTNPILFSLPIYNQARKTPCPSCIADLLCMISDIRPVKVSYCCVPLYWSLCSIRKHPDHARSAFLTNQFGNSPHSHLRFHFSFRLKFSYFEPGLQFQTTNLIQICTTEESGVSPSSYQRTHVGYTLCPSSETAVMTLAPGKTGAPYEHCGFSSPSIRACTLTAICT